MNRILKLISKMSRNQDTFSRIAKGNNSKGINPYTLIFSNSNTLSMRPSQWFWGNMRIKPFISGEQGNKSLKLKGTGEQRQLWGTGNIENEDFDFGEKGKMPIFFRGTREQVPRPHLPRPHLGRVSSIWTFVQNMKRFVKLFSKIRSRNH